MKSMKKFLAVLLIMVTVACSTMTAFASDVDGGSVEVDTIVTIKDAIIEKAGETLEVITTIITERQEELVNNVMIPENLKKVMGERYSAALRLIDAIQVYIRIGDTVYTAELPASSLVMRLLTCSLGVVDNVLPDELAEKLLPLELEFDVPGVEDGTEVEILQYYDDEWHVNDTAVVVENETVEASFEHLGLAIFLAADEEADDDVVVEEPSDDVEVDAPAEEEGGSNLLWIGLGILVVLLIIFFILFKRRKKDEE